MRGNKKLFHSFVVSRIVSGCVSLGTEGRTLLSASKTILKDLDIWSGHR